MKATLYWIAGQGPARLAIVPRPRGGDWLEDEVHAWQRAGVNVIVSLLVPEEIAEFDLSKEPEACGANGIEYIAFRSRTKAFRPPLRRRWSWCDG